MTEKMRLPTLPAHIWMQPGAAAWTSTWCDERLGDDDVEYVRADSIESAVPPSVPVSPSEGVCPECGGAAAHWGTCSERLAKEHDSNAAIYRMKWDTENPTTPERIKYAEFHEETAAALRSLQRETEELRSQVETLDGIVEVYARHSVYCPAFVEFDQDCNCGWTDISVLREAKNG